MTSCGPQAWWCLTRTRRYDVTQRPRLPVSPRWPLGDEVWSAEPPLNRFNRRKSVFAEAYDPEEDDDDGERIIHAKSDDQRSRLSEAVRNIFLFRSLDPDQINEVLDAMFERRVTEGEFVIKQGDDGDNFYVIDTGVFNILVASDSDSEPRLVGKYDNAGSFGELALMYNLPRAATIQAISAGALWAMGRQTFRRILLKSACKKRKMYESLIEKVPMLKTLEMYERMNLADALIPKPKRDGELIIQQGEAADGMYFVEEGTVRIIMVNSNKEEKEISRVTTGGYFGELALVTKKPRAASIYAVGNVRLAFLDVEAFERLLGPCMDLMKRNIEDYENELSKIFGSKANISDIR
ncbi:cAMP-dependent protein kinase type II regulatory subunit isoform X2 [Oratosquilla oratoria]|uniref:cAMP-dependent protein kinase type II regulatory subunit isoform X2 n=1 Tax=Oratosquilla oratoria TaxID=337810 RepID=UPI003F76D3E9